MGSLFSTPKAPRPMDVAQTGQQQQSENTRSAFQGAAFNRVNQSDPFGNSLSYNQTGTDAQGNPVFTASQQLGQTGQQFAGGFAGLGQKYFDAAGSRPDMGSDAAFNKAYDAATAFSAPRQQRETAGLETQLANQGFERGTEGYNNALRDLTERQSATNNTLTARLQNQTFQQGLANRSQQMSELQPGLQFGQNVINPSYVNAPQVNTGGPVDYAGLTNQAYNQQQQQYQQKMQQRNAMIGGLAGIAGTMLGGPIGGAMASSMFGGGSSGGSGGGLSPGMIQAINANGWQGRI